MSDYEAIDENENDSSSLLFVDSSSFKKKLQRSHGENTKSKRNEKKKRKTMNSGKMIPPEKDRRKLKKISGIDLNNGVLMLEIEWCDGEKTWEYADDIKKSWPQEVIDFYLPFVKVGTGLGKAMIVTLPGTSQSPK